MARATGQRDNATCEGRLSARLADTLRRAPHETTALPALPEVFGHKAVAWEDDDLQLALRCGYELHYRGFDDVDEA